MQSDSVNFLVRICWSLLLVFACIRSSPLQAHEWNEFNASQRTVQFHWGDVFSNPGPYSNITWTMALECASGGCGAWDVLGTIEIKQANGEFVQVGRFMTPYGVPTSLEFDMTDLQPLFVGRPGAEMRVTIDIWEEAPKGWKVSWTYRYEKGRPSPMPVAVIPVWNDPPFEGASAAEYGARKSRGHLLDVPEKTIVLPAGATQYRLRSLVTGHGQGNSGNAAEFSAVRHAIIWKKDGRRKAVSRLVWREDCATSTVHPQNGNADDSRAGWCPGRAVTPWVSENLAEDLPQAGEKVSFRYLVDYEQAGYVNTCRPEDCERGTCASYADGVCSYDGNAHTKAFFNVGVVLVAYE